MSFFYKHINNKEIMNSSLKDIIKASASAVLTYAGKCLVNEGIQALKNWWRNRNKKETTPAGHVAEKPDTTVKPVTMKEILNRSKSQSEETERKLFTQGEFHVIVARTGDGKSIWSLELGWATAGGKESEHYAMVKGILGDNWNATKQMVEYIDGENGEDEIRSRYGRADMNCPDNLTVLPAGKISSIDELKTYIGQRAEENKSKGDYTIFVDHPGCYKGSGNFYRMIEFYKALKQLILNYREGGYRLTIFIIGFLDADPCRPVSSKNIKGTGELENIAHTIVALCPCRLGEEYRFLKVLKCRSWESGGDVSVLRKSTENGVFFHFAGKMKEKDALPLPVLKQAASVTFPAVAKDMLETGRPSNVTFVQEENGTAGETAGAGRKHNKVTKEIVLRIKQLADMKMKQGEIAEKLNLCRQTVNRYLQKIRLGKYDLTPSPC